MTVYLAGAGLTRSLQRTRSVPLMMDFTRVLTEFIANDVVLAALVGMEIWDVYEQPCPECRQMAEQIARCRPLASASDAVRQRFARAVSSRKPESIETLLERIETKKVANPHAPSLPTHFRYAINQVFADLGWDLEMAVLESFLRTRFGGGAPHVFISFNYDLVLDKCIESASDGRWQPRNGYGFEIPFYTTDDVQGRSSQDLRMGTGQIKLIKPHGSLNWLVPQDNLGAVDPAEMLLPLTPDAKIRYWPTRQTFNYTSRPGEMPCDMKILIAPPSPRKPKVLSRAASDGFEALIVADDVFVLGYSLPKTDRDQIDLVRNAISQRSLPVSSVTVVNFGEEEEYFDEVEGLFKPHTLRRFNRGFADFVANGLGY